jgi:hypothetical protein
MSGNGLKATVGRQNVARRYVPGPDSCSATKTSSLDHLVGAQLKGRGYVETQRLRSIQIEG